MFWLIIKLQEILSLIYFLKKKEKSFVFEYKDETGFNLDYAFFKVIKKVSVSKNAPKILLNQTFETQIDKTFSSPNSDLQIKKTFTFLAWESPNTSKNWQELDVAITHLICQQV